MSYILRKKKKEQSCSDSRGWSLVLMVLFGQLLSGFLVCKTGLVLASTSQGYHEDYTEGIIYKSSM